MATKRPPFITKPLSAYYHREVPKEDEYLTHVGPGTPAGDYLRRFWQPVGYTHYLTDLPLRVEIMGEGVGAVPGRQGRDRAAGTALPPLRHVSGVRPYREARDTVLLSWLAVRDGRQNPGYTAGASQQHPENGRRGTTKLW